MFSHQHSSLLITAPFVQRRFKTSIHTAPIYINKTLYAFFANDSKESSNFEANGVAINPLLKFPMR